VFLIPILLFVAFGVGASIPLWIPAFAYARIEKRTRHAWAGLPGPTRAGGVGPYRAGELPGVPLRRAPLLIRAAAMIGFYWVCVSMLSWALVVASTPGGTVLGLAATGLGVAIAVALAGARLLRRHPRSIATGRRVAVVEAVHGMLLVGATAALPGSDAIALALVYTLPATAHAALLWTAVGRHRALLLLARR